MIDWKTCRHIKHLILAVFWILFTPQAAFSVPPQIINFDKNEYKAARQNWSVAFDNDGIAYFGNNLGLLEFDGITWKLNPSVNSSIIRTVAVGQDNTVYTGGYRELGYWKRDNSGNLNYVSLSYLVEDNFTTNEEFWNIIIVGKKVCFHSFSGVFIYESGSFTVIKPGGFVNFASGSANEIFMTIKGQGIYKLSGNSYIPVIESTFFNNKTVRFISEFNGPDEYLIGTESNGMFLYDSKTKLFKSWAANSTEYFIQNKLNQGTIAKNGNIIIGTILDGFIVLDRNGNQLYHLSVETGLQSNTVLGISTDGYGNIWLALDKGIDFISFPSTLAYTIEQHNELGALYSAAIYENKLYIATNQGLYQRKWQDNNKPFTLVPNTQEQVWDCRIIDDNLFVGHNFGTFLIHEDNIDKISNFSGGFSIARNPKNPDMLLQSTYSNLVVYKKKSNGWMYSHTVKGFNNLIRHLAFDHLNNLWASHLYQGVYRIRLNDQCDSIKFIKYYGKNSQLGKISSNSAVFIVESRIVLTTREKLYTYDDLKDSIVPYEFLNTNLGVYASSFRIVSAPEHRYWFINKQGLACFEIQQNSIIKIKEYPIALFEHQLIQNYENIIPIEKDKALVCLENGYAILNTASDEAGDGIIEQMLQLKEIISSDKHEKNLSVSFNNKHVNIPYKWNSLTFRYSFPLYSAEKINYQYKIAGLMDNWSETLDKPIFSIKRIPPGKYVLYAKAVNRWGKSSKVHQLKFTINSPWYQSTAAYVSYTLLFALLTFYSRYLTIKRIKLREKRKRLIKEREIVQLRNEKLRSDIAYKSQQLANSTMGIIKKNEFLLSIKEKLKRQKDQLGTRYPDKYFQDIVKKIDDNISGQDDWQIFESNFEQAHETFMINLKNTFPDLTPSDLRLSAYLRINLTSKEIAPLLGISVRGVENHRYRLRKKFNLASDANLIDFIMTI